MTFSWACCTRAVDSWWRREEHVELTKIRLEETCSNRHVDRGDSHPFCPRAEGQGPSVNVEDQGVALGRQVQGGLGAKNHCEVQRPVVRSL